MSRYIDADKIDYTMASVYWGKDNKGRDEYRRTFVAFRSDIDEIPTADVVEVRHGRWIFNPDGTDWGIGAWECSLCKCKNDNLGADNRFSPHIYAGSNFCPHCGAKMDEERKD